MRTITTHCFLCDIRTNNLTSRAINGNIEQLCPDCFEYVVEAQTHNPVQNGAIEGGAL